MNGEDTRSIAELWQEFEYILSHMPIELKARMEEIGLSKFGNQIFVLSIVNGYPRLRAELLERCKKVYGIDMAGLGYVGYTEFWISESSGGLRLGTRIGHEGKWIKEHDSRVFHSRETALDTNAAYAFWAWELEQREKEASNEN